MLGRCGANGHIFHEKSKKTKKNQTVFESFS